MDSFPMWYTTHILNGKQNASFSMDQNLHANKIEFLFVLYTAQGYHSS